MKNSFVTVIYRKFIHVLCYRNGYDVVMTTSLSADVPVGYFSWAEYDIMAPVQPKTEKALAAAFISNCEARNFRLQALEALEKAKIEIDSYGGCHRNRDGQGGQSSTIELFIDQDENFQLSSLSYSLLFSGQSRNPQALQI